MKGLTFFVWWVVVLSAAVADNKRDQFIEMVNAIEAECLMKENITAYGSYEDKEEEMTMKILEWHCFLECVASDMGIVS